MRARHDTFLGVFRAADPPGSDDFRLLRDQLAATADPKLLHDFLAALNRDLARRVESGAADDVAWAVKLCLGLTEASPDAMVAALGTLVNDGTLWFHDPVIAVAFEAASQAPTLLDLLADLADTESQLLQFRVRAMEALVTRSPGTVDADAVGLEAQSALRFLNAIFEELDRGTARAGAESCARWAQGFTGLSRLFPETQGGPEVLAWVAAALAGLGEAPTASATMGTVLRILRTNTPLPSWHPARPGTGRDAGRSHAVGALIVDKAIQVVLATSSARWRASGVDATPRAPRQSVELWPFNARVLEAALVDPSKPPRARAAAAGLLYVLTEASPELRPSPAAELYTELFLAPYRALGSATPETEARADSEWLDPLLLATGDACRPIRYAAIERCRRFAIAHPTWFEPRHYTKLLPLLSDDDPQIRAGAMKTFQALAGFRSRQVATVVGDIAARLHGEAGDGDEAAEVEARRNLEIALGITMDRLVDDVEQLQKDVHVLEARRGELLQYIETQAIRVGEEIHHEVLNTLTGYLATAIDEGNYAESRTWLEALTQELRRIMNNLYPRDLETDGFLPTIRNRLRYAKQHLERRGQRCDVVLDCPPEITDAAIAASAGGPSHVVLLYRIVLEAISNARKHSGGTFIGVSVRAPARGAVEIRISDNGAAGGGPFSENAGMALTRRRAEEIGAEMEYQPTPDGGTAVVIRLGNAAPRPDGGGAPLEDAARRESEGDGEARPAT
jgi:signal transduction histidine kinase